MYLHKQHKNRQYMTPCNWKR